SYADSQDRTFWGMTHDNFWTLHGGHHYFGNYCGWEDPPQCYPHKRPTILCYEPLFPSCPEVLSSSLWGAGYNYLHERSVAVSGWHTKVGYTGYGQGGFAAFERSPYGAAASGVGSSLASSGGPQVFFTGPPPENPLCTQLEGIATDIMVVSAVTCCS